jgi:diguanylate cyclase (GGDEF)-like protein
LKPSKSGKGRGRKAAKARKQDKAPKQDRARQRAKAAAAELVRQREAAERLYQVALVLVELAEKREKALDRRDKLANRRDKAAAQRDQLANERERVNGRSAGPAAERVSGTIGGSASVGMDEAQGSAELERARLEALLQRAHLDPLTGAFRREAGRLALRNEIDRARRGDLRFVLAFVDVDDLKTFNDEQGHAAGDHLLRTLVAVLRANLRSYDPIVRMGGDEFVCGIAAIDVEEVQHRFDVINQSLRHAVGAGISVGFATLTSNETLDELTARADEALLAAKRKRG